MRTFAPRSQDRDPRWFVVDAEGKALGRIATLVAARLMGKHRPAFSPSFDHGDHVIVVNASKVILTGNKKRDKVYRRHTGYPGGLKEVSAGRLLATRPDRVIEAAVAGMLPKSSLGRKQRTRLKVYAGPEHPHEAQNPERLDVRESGR